MVHGGGAHVVGRTLGTFASVRWNVMSMVEEPDETTQPPVGTYAPELALERARPLPPRERLVIEDVSDEEWAAFQKALAEA